MHIYNLKYIIMAAALGLFVVCVLVLMYLGVLPNIFAPSQATVSSPTANSAAVIPVNNAGGVSASVPVASVPVASVPVASIPVASVPVASIPVASVPVASVVVDPCSGFVPGSLSNNCFAQIWKDAGCTTPIIPSIVNWANSNKLSLDAIKDDSKAWATMNDSVHILGCYVTQPAPQNIRMYGPAIGHPVGNLEKLPTGVYQKGDDLIYLLEDGPYVKMVNKAGVARHYEGNLSSFDPARWSNYNDSTGGYFIKSI